MPNYSQSSAALPISSLYPGQSGLSFDAETPTAPQAGKAFCIAALGPGSQPKSVNLEIAFSADPGAFQVDLQEADTDVDAAYVTISGASLTAVNSGFYARVDKIPASARFYRASLVSRTNSVTLTAKLTVSP